MIHAPRILIVDDDAALLQALPQAIALRLRDVAVDTAEAGHIALSQLEKHEYDAIVTDIKMPGMDGLALLQKIQQLRPDVPTLLITGHGEHDLAIQALRGGAYDFIQKPIDRDYFVAALRRAIQTHQMRRQIAEQQKELETYAKSLEQTVQERTRELIEANAAKDVFIGMASHELKTPLTILKGIVQVLRLRHERGKPLDPEDLMRMERSIRRMELLVNDLLNTSLVETGMFALHPQPCDLVALCRNLLDEYRSEMGLQLHLEVPGEKLEVYIDKDRICQVILNLISNARKYSPKHEPITVRIERQDEQSIIAIQDRGVGIPPEKLPHIFERFYRVPDIEVQNGSSVGVGLGLYISQKIVERHGGRIEVQSSPGKGSTFSIILPISADYALADEVDTGQATFS